MAVTAALHPHVGTMVENAERCRRVLDDSGIALCLDTGHLLIGGADPVELARHAPERIAHTSTSRTSTPRRPAGAGRR